MKSILDRCKSYADDVLSGKIPTGTFIKQAAQRFIDDLSRYEWNDARAALAISNFQSRRHWEGSKGGTEIILEPHQIFYFGQLFGFDDEKGRRRFRNVYKQVSRKNGKTIESALLGLYFMECGERAPQVIAVANKEEQAGIVVNSAGRILEESDATFSGRNWTKADMDKPYRNYEYLGRVSKVLNMSNNGRFFDLSKELKNADGWNPYLGIVDEYHSAVDSAGVDIIRSGMGSRIGIPGVNQGNGPLINIITTAGFNKGGPCYNIRDFCIRILNGQIEDDGWLPLIYELDPTDDWTDPDTWIKANPNLDVSVYPEYLMDEYRSADAQGGSALVSFKTKNLNMWTDSAETWIEDSNILACNQRPVQLKDFIGREPWAGVDLAKTRTLTHCVYYHPPRMD